MLAVLLQAAAIIELAMFWVMFPCGFRAGSVSDGSPRCQDRSAIPARL